MRPPSAPSSGAGERGHWTTWPGCCTARCMPRARRARPPSPRPSWRGPRAQRLWMRLTAPAGRPCTWRWPPTAAACASSSLSTARTSATATHPGARRSSSRGRGGSTPACTSWKTPSWCTSGRQQRARLVVEPPPPPSPPPPRRQTCRWTPSWTSPSWSSWTRRATALVRAPMRRPAAGLYPRQALAGPECSEQRPFHLGR
mmetsp:Transcript_43371/g.137973  ORF Transcript_43371/g.137973 Transcript_43371/m.137973 type:complete len:201 (+) Transcript_43371:737-1339(+)